MTRRLNLALLGLLVFASAAWPKMKKEDQDYLDSKIAQVTTEIGRLQEQIRTLKGAIESLSKQLSALQQAQAEFNDTQRQQKISMNDLVLTMNIMRQSHSNDIGGLREQVALLSSQMARSLNVSTARSSSEAADVTSPTATALNPPNSTQAPAPPRSIANAKDYYVTAVNGDDVVVGLGSSTQSLHVGSKLAWYKQSDANTRVGELEVTSIMDGDNSRARIVGVNSPNARPDFGDIVRPQ